MSYRGNELPEAKSNPGLTTSYVSAVDGNTYNVLYGYGAENPEFLRGKNSGKDTFMVTTFKLTYILGKNFQRAKFR
jgi:hypothetical protein